MVDIKSLEREMVGRGHRVIGRAYQDMFRPIYCTRFVDSVLIALLVGLSLLAARKGLTAKQ